MNRSAGMLSGVHNLHPSHGFDFGGRLRSEHPHLSAESFTVTDPSIRNRTSESDVPDIFGLFTRVAANIFAGARVAFFRPFSGREFNVGAWHLFILAVIDICIAIAYDYVSIDPDRYFSTSGFMYSATGYLLFVFAIFVVATIQCDDGGTPRLLVILLSTVPAVSIVSLPITYAYYGWDRYSLSGGWAMWITWLVWGLAIVYRSLKDRYSSPRRRIVGLVVLYMLVATVPRLFVQDVPYWYSYNPEDYAEYEKKETVNTEKTYYAQPELLEQTALTLSDQRPGVTDLYFVGFGSYASQDVFMKEVNYVRDLFDSNYETNGRSVVLINNEKTVHDVPLANPSNLRITLKNIAARMDTEEDVLFLYLTSHGSEDAVLSANFWPITPNNLSVGELHEILTESGIKWRILAISACYSGSFIDGLKNDHSLILTAAHKNKKSFGCSNDREFTYFGEHYFARELRAGGSFVEAFHRARSTLLERETSEGVEPSDPQIFIGSEMEKKLGELDERFPVGAAKIAQSASATLRHCHQRFSPAPEGLSDVHGKPVVENRNVNCRPSEDRL